MSKVNKSKSNALGMLLIDLEVTTEEVHEQLIMFGEGDREWLVVVTSHYVFL